MTTRFTLIISALLATVASAQTVPSPVRFAWNPSASADGYRLTIDSGPPSQWVDTQTTPLVVPPGPHTATVTAFNADGESAPSVALPFVVQASADPACAPLGTRAVSIFVTTLTRVGTTGGPLSVARLDFQLASPNSPVTHAAVRTNGAELAAVDGTSLTALAGLWFAVPAARGTYVLSVSASNAYGCTNEVFTTKSVTVR